MIEQLMAHKGEILAVTTALVWALAVIFFKKSGDTVHPMGLNLYKNSLAFVLLSITLLVMGDFSWPEMTTQQFIIIIISGILGLGISDALFFKSLNLLGAGLIAIVDCLYSPLVIILSFFWLGEKLSWLQIAGTCLILSAILTAANKKSRANITRKDQIAGVIYGVLAMITVALSIVMVKPLLSQLPLMMVVELRIAAGLAATALIIAVHPQRKIILQSLLIKKNRAYTFLGSFIGTYMAQILWVAGMKFTLASIAAVLNQSSNVFIFLMAAWFLHEPLNKQRILGIILGVLGVILVSVG
jgi:drug/metabolite transporter (DMT)-like permease